MVVQRVCLQPEDTWPGTEEPTAEPEVAGGSREAQDCAFAAFKRLSRRSSGSQLRLKMDLDDFLLNRGPRESPLCCRPRLSTSSRYPSKKRSRTARGERTQASVGFIRRTGSSFLRPGAAPAACQVQGLPAPSREPRHPVRAWRRTCCLVTQPGSRRQPRPGRVPRDYARPVRWELFLEGCGPLL